MLLDKYWVQTECGVRGWLRTGQLPDPFPVRLVHAEHHDALYTGSLAA